MERNRKRDISEKGAIVQRDGESYAIVPRIPCGYITDFNILRKIADVADTYGAKAIKVTSAQRLAIIGLAEEHLDQIWQELKMSPGAAFGLCVRGIKACPGTQHCRLGQQDSLGLGIRIEERFVLQPVPSKMKISVSGCPMDCAEAHVRDIGLIGGKNGYTIEIGGAVGPNPRIGQVFAKELDPKQAEEIVEKIIDAYRLVGKKKRLGKIIESMGLDAFMNMVK